MYISVFDSSGIRSVSQLFVPLTCSDPKTRVHWPCLCQAKDASLREYVQSEEDAPSEVRFSLQPAQCECQHGVQPGVPWVGRWARSLMGSGVLQRHPGSRASFPFILLLLKSFLTPAWESSSKLIQEANKTVNLIMVFGSKCYYPIRLHFIPKTWPENDFSHV